jgi:hypothetical protein
MFVLSLYQIYLPVPTLTYFARSCQKVQKIVACPTLSYTGFRFPFKSLHIFGKLFTTYHVSRREGGVTDAAATSQTFYLTQEK